MHAVQKIRQSRFPAFSAVVAIALAATIVGSTRAGTTSARVPTLVEGSAFATLRVDPASPELPRFAPGWDRATFWDLSGLRSGLPLNWIVIDPGEVGLTGPAQDHGADLALCAFAEGASNSVGCRLFLASDVDAAGPVVRWSNLADERADVDRVVSSSDRRLKVGARLDVAGRAAGNAGEPAGLVVAEGTLLLASGPRAVVLLRERRSVGDDSWRVRYRFIDASGIEAARLEGPTPGPGHPFEPDLVEVLTSSGTLADDGIVISYPALNAALTPGATGFVQYSVVVSTPLTDIDPTWTSVSEMIAIDESDVPYQPDPNDPTSEITLPEVWNFTGLPPALLDHRTFNTTRDDTAGASCFAGCTTRDVSDTPPDGSWQAYLKIDTYESGGDLVSQDYFALNNNDTGADPSIDVPYTAQAVGDPLGWTQVCFEQSAGGDARLLRFFQFTGADPASAVLGVGDSWTSGAWTECDTGNGLHLTLSSQCGAQCYPGCSSIAPFARGRLGDGAGFGATIVEDGYVHVPSGNYLPAVLLRQDTDVQAGVDFITTCSLGTTPLRAFDYFWVSEHYGLLALVSSPSSETIDADDWSSVGNVTDGADFTWGPFPPYQITAQACLDGTRVDWALPADGSNLTGEPGTSDWGYVVSWGDADDPEALADWDTNPNHTPLPGEEGYLAAPPGAEPKSLVITDWDGSTIDATVVTALRYTDPDVRDQVAYRSAALFKVAMSPAKLSGRSFRVGAGVAPFVTRSGDDLELGWPAVEHAESYLLRVWNLDTGEEVACPAGLDCAPVAPSAIHADAAVDGMNYGYRAYAVDGCGGVSSD